MLSQPKDRHLEQLYIVRILNNDRLFTKQAAAAADSISARARITVLVPFIISYLPIAYAAAFLKRLLTTCHVYMNCKCLRLRRVANRSHGVCAARIMLTMQLLMLRLPAAGGEIAFDFLCDSLHTHSS